MPAAAFPPGPKGPILLGNLLDFERDRLGFLLSTARQYGDVVPISLLGGKLLLISDPALIEEVLVQKYRSFTKGQALRGNRLLFGNGILTSEGDFWRRQRKLMVPAFHRERINSYGEYTVAAGQRILGSWCNGQTYDINAEMLRLTLDVVVKTLFDTEVPADVEKIGHAMEIATECALKRTGLLMFVPESVPIPTNLRMRRAVSILDRIVYGFIAERRKTGAQGNDLLSLLIAAQDEDGSQMTDKQLRDEAMTLFLAGHETTALALSWALYLLSQNPDTEAKLLAEIDTVFQGATPTVADRAKLVYTEQVILETMRLYPPAWTLGRAAIEDVQIGPYTVPKDWTVMASQWVLHYDPRYFDSPDEFLPERWENDFAKTLPKYAYFPFGGGPRICIGNTFAIMESILLLATIMQRCRFTFAPGQKIVLEPGITLRPATGLKMTLHQRQPAALEPV